MIIDGIPLPTDLSNGRHPYNWWLFAHTQLRAAQLLFAEFERVFAESRAKDSTMNAGDEREVAFDEQIGERLFYPAFMLLGLAVETALKGVLVGYNPSVIGDDKPKSQITTHNLLQLADQCKILFSSEERELLSLLENFVRWSGRYPIPTKLRDYKSFARMLNFPQDFVRATSIFIKINEVLTHQKPFSWLQADAGNEETVHIDNGQTN